MCNQKLGGSDCRMCDFGEALPVSKTVITAVIIHSMNYVSAQSLSSPVSFNSLIICSSIHSENLFLDVWETFFV